METWIVALSIASLLTSSFTFRYRAWDRPLRVLAYFLFFSALEWLAGITLLPPGTLPLGVAWVCFGLTGLFSIAIWIARKAEGRRGPRG